jgi:RHS repeat-associated protein
LERRNYGYPGYGTGYGTGYGYPGYGYGYGTGYGYPGYGWGTTPAPGTGTQPEQPEWPFPDVIKPAFTQTIEKSFTLDYTSEDKDVILEKENGGLSFKFNYGLEKVSALIEGPTYGYCNLYVNGKAKVYFHEDRLGSTEYITDDFGGNILSYIDYDPWGVPTNKAVVMLGFRAVDLVAEYTGHPYDNVLSAYFAEARMYDAADRRFLAADAIKGNVANPLTMVPYTYVLDNPMKYVDLLGLIGTFIELGGTYIKDYYNIGKDTYYGNLSEVLGAYGAASVKAGKNQYKIGNLDLTYSQGSLIITGKNASGRNIFLKTIATRNLLEDATQYIDIDYFAKIMCGFGYDKSVTKTDTLLNRGEMSELIAKYGMSQSQAQVLYKMNWYFAKNTNVNEKLKSGLAVFAFEGFGNYEGESFATYHPNNRYGAMLVAVVDGKVKYLTANASTLPDFGLKTPEDLILKNGVYGVTSHNHKGIYAALKVFDLNPAPDQKAIAAPVYRSTGGDKNADGINIHMASTDGISSGSPSSIGCVIIQYQDYPGFTNAIGLTDDALLTPGNYEYTKITEGIYNNSISGVFVNDRSGFPIEDYIKRITHIPSTAN